MSIASETKHAWLGNIPNHWKICPIKYCASRFYSGGTPDSGKDEFYCSPPNGHPWLMIADMTKQRYIRETKKAITIKGLRSKSLELLPPGTILFSMYASLGAVSMLTIDAAVNQAILGIKPKNKLLHAEFFLYQLEAIAPYMISLSSSSTQHNLNAEKVRNLRIILPPLKEQTIIAQFLNSKNEKINSAIAEKEKLLRLLAEQQRAIIHQTVTRGLDSFVSLKPSGVAWLDDIPSHWDIRRVKTIVTNVNKKSKCKDSPYVDMDSIEGWTGKATPKIGEYLFVGDIKSFVKNDVLFGKLRPYLAKVLCPEYSGVCATDIFVLRSLTKNLYPPYMKYLFLSKKFIEIVNSSTFGAKMPRTNWDFFGNILIPFPHIEEQKAITKYLGDTTAKIDAAIAATKREIELLREYRERLISDAVTGKIDLRGFVPPPQGKKHDNGHQRKRVRKIH